MIFERKHLHIMGEKVHKDCSQKAVVGLDLCSKDTKYWGKEIIYRILIICCILWKMCCSETNCINNTSWRSPFSKLETQINQAKWKLTKPNPSRFSKALCAYCIRTICCYVILNLNCNAAVTQQVSHSPLDNLIIFCWHFHDWSPWILNFVFVDLFIGLDCLNFIISVVIFIMLTVYLTSCMPGLTSPGSFQTWPWNYCFPLCMIRRPTDSMCWKPKCLKIGIVQYSVEWNLSLF